MLTSGTSAEAKPTASRARTSARGPSISAAARRLHRLGFGGVGVGVVLEEVADDRAAGLAAVLPDALLLRLARVAADRPVRERYVRPVGERLAVLSGPRQCDELVLELAALELRGDRPDLVELG